MHDWLVGVVDVFVGLLIGFKIKRLRDWLLGNLNDCLLSLLNVLSVGSLIGCLVDWCDWLIGPWFIGWCWSIS